MKTVKTGTKEAQAIINTFTSRWANKGDIWEAYGKPSATKVSIWREIEKRAKATDGYNDDLRVTGRNCYTFSTIYSYTQNDVTYIVCDTKGGTKVTEWA